MKAKLCLVAGLAFMLTACVEKYTLIAECPDDNGKMAYILDMATGETIDSVVVADGKIFLEGTIESPQLCQLAVRPGYKKAIFALEGGDIAIDFMTSTASGTAMNDSINNFFVAARKSQQDLMSQYRSLDRKAPDFTEKVDAINRAMSEAMGQLAKHHIAAMPASPVSTFCLINWLQMLTDPQDFEKAATYISKYDLANATIKKMVDVNAAKKATAPGQMFTDFTIEKGNLDGTSVSLSDYVGKGKYVLVDFWASWCGPCRAEIPNVKEIYNQYKGEKFEILSVAVWDERDASLKAIEELSLPWPQIISAGEIPTRLYGIAGIPQIILFAPDGTILERNLRGEKMKKTIADLFVK